MLNKDNIYEEMWVHLPTPVFCKDLNLKFIDCNEAFARDAGVSRSEITGKTDFDLAWKSMANKYREDDVFVIKNKESISFDEEHVSSDGKKKIVSVIKSPLFSVDNEVCGLMGVYIDITAEKELEQAEKTKMEEKIHYTRLAAGSIAHDLRTPLASIGFSMDSLEKALPEMMNAWDYAVEHGFSPEKPVRKRRLEATVRSVPRNQRMLKFANHYIDMVLGNLKHDSINTDNYRKYNVTQVVDHALEVYPWDEDEKALLHWDPKIDFDFHGDDFCLQNIMNNIIKNACFYIKQARKGEIFIWTAHEDDCFTLHVKDTASGAPAEVLEKMFDGYYSKRDGGTGLGLAFCKSIMVSFGGSITAESVEGEYMEFILTFPRLSA